jgi:hypothetical protein
VSHFAPAQRKMLFGAARFEGGAVPDRGKPLIWLTRPTFPN